MNKRHFWLSIILLLLPAATRAQDARAMAVGYASTAAPLGIFGIYWNPALEAIPQGNSAWNIAAGFSAFDTSNTNTPILRFSPSNAMQSGQDPVQRFQDYSGLFAVRYGPLSFAAIYDQNLNYTASQGALSLFNDRSNNAAIAGGASYNLNYLQTQQQIDTFILSYAMPLPLGSFQFLSAGGSLKYHYGTQYTQTTLTGTYTQNSNTGYQYSKITSNSGLGLSMDLGLYAKISDMLNVGFMMQNIQSTYNWQAQQQNYTLDPNTGQDVLSGPSSSVTVVQPFPYTTKLGASIATPDKSTFLEGEVSWVNQTTHWKGGLEKYYAGGLVIRAGTFSDDTSGQQLWTFGVGFFKPNFTIDLSCVTRSIPNLQDSLALGGGIDAAVLF
jgi:hypothetical protein